MRRDFIGLMHAGYWGLYLTVLALLLMMLRLPHGAGRPLAGLLAAWPILVLSLVPNVAAFYVAYGPLFSRLLARRRPALSLGAGVSLSLAASAFGLFLAFLLFGGDQPVFSSVGETAALAGSLWVLAGIHVVIALVMRGFVSWYGDLRVKEELTTRTHQMELALIRSRLDPHFLFNTLNNIDTLISRNPDEASRYLN